MSPQDSPASSDADVTKVDLMTPEEVAKLFRVDPKTVTRWAARGRLRSTRTPGGHRRFRREHVAALLRETE
jgi:excisionase family DNA binding protein